MAALILTRADVAALLDLPDCINAVEEAFRQHALGSAVPPAVLSIHADHGAFHIKAAGVHTPAPYFAAKVNGNFSGNRERFGLPTIQGVIVLADLNNGTPLAIMDAIEITMMRTGAATASRRSTCRATTRRWSRSLVADSRDACSFAASPP